MTTTTELVQRFSRVEQEIRDLKTAHQRGVGVVELYAASSTAEIKATTTACTVTVTFEDGEPLPGFCQLGIVGLKYDQPTAPRAYLASLDYKDGGKTIVYGYQVAGADGTSLQARAVSFSRIKEIEMETE